jgi:hypothetical protein
MKNLIAITLFGLGLTLGCNNKNCSNTPCTMEYAMMLVELSSSSNPTLSGIRTESVLLNNNIVLAKDSSKNAFQGKYFELVTDSHLKLLGYNSRHAVVFKVYQADSLIYTGNYLVGTDCCHIRLEEGKVKVEL